ncbi:hypothetical protein FVE85_3323 [Porphyridium purpureum]|uniref:Haem-binding uptake Tiki superfamily ChaN domain-containing protein n=1 Tax=Porphyridium purpureum TaxID=35688 RepID=A0A5J4YW85_PORPP|nr:hypothetical protein FVE85_3323 [Porphyridium purpureum]|eukprot:POR5037..scf227_4
MTRTETWKARQAWTPRRVARIKATERSDSSALECTRRLQMELGDELMKRHEQRQRQTHAMAFQHGGTLGEAVLPQRQSGRKGRCCVNRARRGVRHASAESHVTRMECGELESGREAQPTRRDLLRSVVGVGLGLGLGSGSMGTVLPAWADMAQLQHAPRVIREGERIFDTRIGSYLPIRAAMEHLPRYLRGNTNPELADSAVPPSSAQKRLLVIGEEHTHPLHHRMQLDVIKTLRQNAPTKPLAIGLEHFYRQHQGHLDDYVYGRIGLNKLKERTKWDEMWGHDFNFWLPIFAYARQHGIRLVGLNLPSKAVQIVAERGLDSVPEKLRSTFPEIDLSNQKHYNRFASNMMGVHADVAGAYLKSYYEAYCLWEDYMADSASQFLQNAPGFKNGQGQLVILAGAAHVEGRNGIPDRLSRRMGGEDVFTIVPKSVSFTSEGLPHIQRPEKRDTSDWVWYTRRPVDLV